LAGGNVATQQDLSAYFFARSVELYLRNGGVIAFVMPYSVLSRKQFAGFRRGSFGGNARGPNPFTWVRFIEGWAMGEEVQPLFPVPSCVLIGKRTEPGRLPATVMRASGQLIHRDASPLEANERLSWVEENWPQEATFSGGSPYRAKFKDGATIYPRILCLVTKVPTGALGENREAPLVESRRSTQDKEPWKSLRPIRQSVESSFLRSLYLGESIAPFRALSPSLAVILSLHQTRGDSFPGMGPTV